MCIFDIRLVVGSLCGAVLIFEAIMRRTVWRDKYEVIYIAANQVLVKPLGGGSEPVTITSKYDTEIDDVRFMGEQRRPKLVCNNYNVTCYHPVCSTLTKLEVK